MKYESGAYFVIVLPSAIFIVDTTSIVLTIVPNLKFIYLIFIYYE